MISCSNCLWFAPEGKSGAGRCLADPPVVQVVMPPPTAIGSQPKPMLQGLRPPTASTDRCSRWYAADQAWPRQDPWHEMRAIEKAFNG